jgi:DNA polymerase (family 10)
LEKKIPRIIELKDIKGDLHIHSNWSDGVNTIKELADYARKEMGYKYIGVADHANLRFMKNNLSPKNVNKRIKIINDLNSTYSNFNIYNCVEANIKTNGSIDMPDKFLSKFDYVIASIHYGFKLSKSEMTNRLLKALDNEHVRVLGHPTGRKLLSKQSYDFDFERVVNKAVDKRIALEIDAFPDRLDLNDKNSIKAKSLNAKLVINTDAHQKKQMNYMRLGVGVARRAMLTKKNVLNTSLKPF